MNDFKINQTLSGAYKNVEMVALPLINQIINAHDNLHHNTSNKIKIETNIRSLFSTNDVLP